MWMEENIGKRINMERVDEAISTETDTIATGCPWWRISSLCIGTKVEAAGSAVSIAMRGKSAAVSTRTTPGTASALPASMPDTRPAAMAAGT